MEAEKGVKKTNANVLQLNQKLSRDSFTLCKRSTRLPNDQKREI